MAKEKLSIAAMLPLTKSVTVGTGTIDIRPLDMDEIIKLLVRYEDDFVALWNVANADKPDFNLFPVSSKTMVAEIIALASDRFDELDDIMKLPGTVKLTLLSEILVLSVPDPKKLVEAVTGVLALINRLQNEKSSGQPNDSAKISSP